MLAVIFSTEKQSMYNHPRGKRCDVSKQERRSGETSIKRISRSKKIFCTGQLIRLKSKQRFLNNTQCKAQRSEAVEEDRRSEAVELWRMRVCFHYSFQGKHGLIRYSLNRKLFETSTSAASSRSRSTCQPETCFQLCCRAEDVTIDINKQSNVDIVGTRLA
jgi:hypothetical protein